MSELRHQFTLAQSAEVAGFGYWSGRDVRVEFRPAAANAGYSFVRCDLPQELRIPVDAALRENVPRRTVLKQGNVSVEMIEHVLAALAGLEIDNCEIWVNAPEMPGCDGSSKDFVAAIRRAGVVAQEELIQPLVVERKVRVGDERTWVEAQPSERAALSIEYNLDYGPNSTIGKQSFSFELDAESFYEEISACRTFLLKSEADWLASQGLGSRVKATDLLVFPDDEPNAGPIDNELLFADECVRHKVLDVVGDLALAGCPIHGHIVAHCSGHALNAELVMQLLKASTTQYPPSPNAAPISRCA